MVSLGGIDHMRAAASVQVHLAEGRQGPGEVADIGTAEAAPFQPLLLIQLFERNLLLRQRFPRTRSVRVSFLSWYEYHL